MNKRIVTSLFPLIISLFIMVSVIQLSLATGGLFMSELTVSGAIIFLLLTLKAGSSSSEITD